MISSWLGESSGGRGSVQMQINLSIGSGAGTKSADIPCSLGVGEKGEGQTGNFLARPASLTES